MKYTKSFPVGAASLTVILFSAGMPGVSTAAPDKFRIVCKEIGDAGPGQEPEYKCWMKTGFFNPDGPKKPTHPGGGKFPRDRDFEIDMKTMFVEEKESDGIKPDACPGWFFVNGKWRYFAAPPCPTIQIRNSGTDDAPTR